MKRRICCILVITLLVTLLIPQLAYAASILKKGSRGSQVIDLQNRLIKLGYLSGKADGIYGPLTEQAVKKFQKDHGLIVDGIAGPKTLSSLYGDQAKSSGSSSSSSSGSAQINRTLKLGSKGSDVAELQKRLNALSFNAGTPDGIFGSKTLNAVRAFQKAHGLTVDGIVGPKTRAAYIQVQVG